MGSITGVITSNEQKEFEGRKYRSFEIDEVRFDLNDDTQKFPIDEYCEVTAQYKIRYVPAKGGLKRPARVIHSITKTINKAS